MIQKIETALQSTAALQAKHDALQAENEALREAVRKLFPQNVCVTNRNIPDDFTVSLDITMGELREAKKSIDALLEERP